MTSGNQKEDRDWDVIFMNSLLVIGAIAIILIMAILIMAAVKVGMSWF